MLHGFDFNFLVVAAHSGNFSGERVGNCSCVVLVVKANHYAVMLIREWLLTVLPRPRNFSLAAHTFMVLIHK